MEQPPEQSWDYTVIPMGTLLYRATETPHATNKNRATYYTASIQTANTYLDYENILCDDDAEDDGGIPKEKYLEVYRTNKDLRVFNLNSLSNINKLLRETFEDKTLIIPEVITKKLPGKTLYDIIRNMFTGVSWVVAPVEDTPIQLTQLKRYSAMENDLAFSNWLCNHNFNGYDAPIMTQKYGHPFPAETMVCKPKDDLIILETYKMFRQLPPFTKLEEIINRLQN
tara:strand:- start:478 stop:1155 length:678 start_codon:yes stop_codon:yes gene_type:complete